MFGQPSKASGTSEKLVQSHVGHVRGCVAIEEISALEQNLDEVVHIAGLAHVVHELINVNVAQVQIGGQNALGHQGRHGLSRGLWSHGMRLMRVVGGRSGVIGSLLATLAVLLHAARAVLVRDEVALQGTTLAEGLVAVGMRAGERTVVRVGAEVVAIMILAEHVLATSFTDKEGLASVYGQVTVKVRLTGVGLRQECDEAMPVSVGTLKAVAVERGAAGCLSYLVTTGAVVNLAALAALAGGFANGRGRRCQLSWLLDLLPMPMPMMVVRLGVLMDMLLLMLGLRLLKGLGSIGRLDGSGKLEKVGLSQIVKVEEGQVA